MSAAPVEQWPPAERGRIFVTAENLTRAASPVFGLMALLTLYADSAGNALCGSAGGVPWNSMAAMYLLMCVVHLPPWLKLLSRQRSPRSPLLPRPLAGEEAGTQAPLTSRICPKAAG